MKRKRGLRRSSLITGQHARSAWHLPLHGPRGTWSYPSPVASGASPDRASSSACGSVESSSSAGRGPPWCSLSESRSCQRLVATLRYGLDGGPGRTFREIGRCSAAPRPGRASCYGAPSPVSRWRRWAQIRPRAPHAVPAVPRCIWPLRCWAIPPTSRPPRAFEPLVELEVALRAWGADQALCRAVAAIHPNRSEGSTRPRGPRAAHRSPTDRAGGGSPPRHAHRGRQRTRKTRRVG
jgi:hypothetical protein